MDSLALHKSFYIWPSFEFTVIHRQLADELGYKWSFYNLICWAASSYKYLTKISRWVLSNGNFSLLVWGNNSIASIQKDRWLTWPWGGATDEMF